MLLANNAQDGMADFDFEAFLHLDGMGLDLGFMFNEQPDWANYTGDLTGQQPG